MLDNPVKTRLAAGGSAFGTMVFEFFSPGMPQILRAAGCEFVMFDMEHSGAGIDIFKPQLAACRGIGLVPMLRVPTLQYHFIARALDLGVMGVMVPMVETVEQAREFVACTRYPPTGRRGAAFGIAHDDYEGGSVADKIAAAHARTMAIAMIETPTGVANVDAIAATDGIDVLWLGHFDLTNFMGIPAQFDHPDFHAACDAIAAAARKHGKVAAISTPDEAMLRAMIGRGFRLLSYGLDHQVYQAALSGGLAMLRGIAGK